MNFIRRFFTILTCLMRLCVVLLIATFSALNKILFDKMEIISASLIMRPQEPERNMLGFIDKLCANNRELVQGGSIPVADAFDNRDPFVPDDILIEGEEEIAFEGEELPSDILDESEPTEDESKEIEPEKIKPEETKPKKRKPRNKKPKKNDENKGGSDEGQNNDLS